MDIPKNRERPNVRNQNPITSDPALTRLLEDAKRLESRDEFKGWKDSFLDVYSQYLDPAGVDNAHASDKRLLRSMEKLAATVVSVKSLVDEGKITAESQTVMGKRALTNMTDQLAEAEKEIARFMPTTGAEEQTVGYDKFELGAVMIEDGFHVYELLKSTESIVVRLQTQVLNDVLSKNKLSIIQFYLRQIQSFCDVMADLGLFGLMENVMEMYKVKPRSKEKPVKTKEAELAAASSALNKRESLAPRASQQLPEKEPQIVELDPDKIYNFRSSFTGGYIDPFSGTAPGNDEEPLADPSGDKNEDQTGDDGDDDFIVYFDMKTGSIGKLSRKACVANSLIVSVSKSGEETLDGEIEDGDEKEKLIWDMKKAMKSKRKGNSDGKGSQSSRPQSSRVSNTYVVTPKTIGKGTINRSKSENSTDGNLRGLQAPCRDKDDGVNAGNSTVASPSKSKRPSSRIIHNPVGRTSSFSDVDLMGVTDATENMKEHNSMSSINFAGRKNDPAPSSDGWAKPVLTRNVSGTVNKRPSIQKVANDPKDPKPSNDGWANASSMASSRRKT